MIINDIEYNISLCVTNSETEEEIAEEVFEDFAQMNEFLEKTYMEEKFEDAVGEYTFVEVLDGVPDTAGDWFFDVSPYMPLDDEEIKDVIYEMEVIIPNQVEAIRKRFDENQLFKPTSLQEATPEKRTSKDLPLSEFVYLCPTCMNELENCTCNLYPYYAIQIDRMMVPIIKELNSKGYLTRACCAGHPEYNVTDSPTYIYIAFRNQYDFPVPFPEGSVYRKAGETLSYELLTADKEWDTEDISKYQKDCLDKLMQWSKLLPENK